MERKFSLAWQACVVVSLSLASCDRSDHDAARWLDLEIVRPEVTLVDPPAVPVPDAEGLITKVIRVPPTFFYSAPSSPSDPFADPDTRPRRLLAPQEVFEDAGIQFGPGAFIRADPSKSVLIIRQTPDQMELVEVYTWSGGSAEQEISIRLELYEMPSPFATSLIRSASPHTDHEPEHRAATTLLREGEARLVQSITLSCRSGQRARNEDGYELSYSIPTKDVGASESEDRPIKSTGLGTPRRVGTWLEADPVLGAYEVTIDLRIRLEFHPADPVWRHVPGIETESALGTPQPQFPLKTLEFNSVLLNGETRLIGSWRTEADGENPEEKSSHLVFLQAFVTSDQPIPAP